MHKFETGDLVRLKVAEFNIESVGTVVQTNKEAIGYTKKNGTQYNHDKSIIIVFWHIIRYSVDGEAVMGLATGRREIEYEHHLEHIK